MASSNFTMKRTEAMALNISLHTEGLKVKYLSSSAYVELIGLKRPLAKYIDNIVEEEQELCKAYDLSNAGEIAEKKKTDKSFAEKLEAIQAPEFQLKNRNFIPADEFKKFTDEIDFGTASILAEYLLKEQ